MKPGLFRTIALTYGTQLLAMPLSLASSALQARVLGSAGRGQLSVLQTTVGIAVLYLGLGLPSAITYHLASKKVSLDQLKGPLSRYLVFATAALSAILGVLLITGLEPKVLGHGATPRTIALVVALFTLTIHNAWMAAVLSSRRDFGAINRITLVAVAVPVAGYGLALALGTGGLDPLVIAFSVLLSNEFIKAVLYALRVWAPQATTALVESTTHPIRVMIGFSLLAWACDSIQFLTYRLDVWLVSGYHGDSALGQYSLAVTLGEMVWLLASAIAAVFFPHVPTMERSVAIALTCRLAAFSFVASFGLALIGFLLSIPLLPIIFTAQFEPSVQLLGILLIGVVPYSIAKVVGNYLAGSGAMRFSLYSALVSMVVCVTLDLIFIPRFGAIAAAGATATAYCVFTAVIVESFRRREKLSWSDVLRHARTPQKLAPAGGT
ncbi:MAG: polysaccharide biosynthesis C-terminal domain-containing protein [Archangium sp.]|nr:polysaccharide biosynthesis C-terminal domain-containing protein [Archangium sp.]